MPLPQEGNVDKNQFTAFGEQSVAELHPVFQGEFSYNINPKLYRSLVNSGAATVDTNRAKLSTGAAANQSSQIVSRFPIKYRPGQGGLVRFTAVFTTGVSNSTQIIGVGDTSDGYFFGYNGADFGILRRYGGANEVRTLTVTTKSTTAENITITLDGDADATVAVTDATAGDVTTTANDIASHDFSSLGRGWEAHAEGATVVFISYNAGAKSGAYSLSGASTAVGTFAQTLAGASPTDTWVAQSAWNVDKMDGTGKSKMVLDKTKGNIYQIRYQWLGYGDIKYYIKNQENDEWQLVHKISYSNQNTTPSVYNPTFPLCAIVENTSNTSDIVMYTASWAGFIEGATNGGDLHHGISATVTNSGTAEIPILTILNKSIYQGKINRNQIKLVYMSVGIEHTKNSTIRFRYNAALTGASFADIDTNSSVVSYDSTATGVSGGDTQFAIGLPKDGHESLPLSDATFSLNPGDSLTITQESASVTGAVTTASFNWEELF